MSSVLSPPPNSCVANEGVLKRFRDLMSVCLCCTILLCFLEIVIMKYTLEELITCIHQKYLFLVKIYAYCDLGLRDLGKNLIVFFLNNLFNEKCGTIFFQVCCANL